MHNWHLLLFAFLAFLHSIVCFSEQSLVDGREQCCDRNSLLRDTRLSGTFLSEKPSEDRRLNSRVEIRKDRRHEVRKDISEITRLAANRRLVDFRNQREASRNSREIAVRLTLNENQRVRLVNDRRERTLPALESRVRRFSPDFRRIASNDISRDERIQDNLRQRYSRDFNTRLHERDNRESRRLSRVISNRMVRNSGDEARHTASYDSRRDNQRISDREVTNEFRRDRDLSRGISTETRNLLQRARTDMPRSGSMERMDERRAFRLRSDSRLQRDTKREHRSLEREISDSRDTRRWTLASRSADRISSIRYETSSRVREDGRDKRQRVDSRRILNERLSDESREVRDQRQHEHRARTVTIHRALRERTSEERRSSRNSVDRVRNIDSRDVRLERVVSRRDSRADERPARVYNRVNKAASENRRLESRTMNQEIRQHENVLSRKDRRSSDRMEIRDMKREARRLLTVAGERGTNSIEQRTLKNNAERGDADSSLRTNAFRRARESFASTNTEKAQPAEQSTVFNWQHLFYTLQGVYLCSLLIQIMSENGSTKKSR